MEDNVALDSNKQKQFVKSIKGIKKLIKKDDTTPEGLNTNDGKVRKKRPKQRGLVYLSHIPHGFYEHEMTQYFKQFGVVTNVRVIRSKRTGNSRGHAFVEFRDPAVGEIVAETMNNYLMGKRLIKAAYIPPEKQKQNALRKHWNAKNNPGNDYRIKMKKVYNENRDEEGELKRSRKLLSNFTRTKKKLSELGIDYGFFTPVDVPEALLVTKVKVKKEENDSSIVDNDENGSKSKKNKKKAKIPVEIEDKDVTSVEVDEKTSSVNVEKKNKKGKKNKVQNNDVNEQQKQKQHTLKEAGVKSMDNFIKINQDSDDGTESDDSSYVFDSDEYEKMIEQEDEFNSNISSGSEDYSDDSDNEHKHDEESDSVHSEQEPTPAKGKAIKTTKVTHTLKIKKNADKQDIKNKFPLVLKKEKKHKQDIIRNEVPQILIKAKKHKQVKQDIIKNKVPQVLKRSAPQSSSVEHKKPKLEKQSGQKKSKLFKKRK